MAAGLPSIRRLHSVSPAEVDGLVDVVLDSVEGGASIGFMLPLSRERAHEFWSGIADAVGRGDRALLVAEDAEGICGTVHLILAQPDNQPHRADLSKMLVHSRARHRGLGAALMQAAEELAVDCGKTLLVLDTVTDSDAYRLYARLGWQKVGDVPDFALWPEGGLCSTTYFYRMLP
jgi:GNAT superfamily N-acetyltransferase